jgi:hypothetical protein
MFSTYNIDADDEPRGIPIRSVNKSIKYFDLILGQVTHYNLDITL